LIQKNKVVIAGFILIFIAVSHNDQQ